MSQTFAVISSLIVGGGLGAWFFRFSPSARDRIVGLAALLVLFAVTGAVGLSGALADFSRVPPPFAGFLLAVVLLAVGTALSPWGARLAQATPLRLLIGLQAFRLLPETLLDLAWRDGVAPVQMTFHGRNGDGLTALLALVLAATWPRLRHHRAVAWLFSGVGLALLANILIIALLSAPTPLRVFADEPSSAFVTRFPFIWLPGIQVFAALLLHAITIRKLAGGATGHEDL